MKVRFFLFFILTLIISLAVSGNTLLLAQSNDDEDEDYSREFVWGINKNTNGGFIGGFNFKISNRTAPGTYRTLGFEAVNIKHPKEIKFNGGYGGGNYILNKINYLYALRFSYGQERVLFKKGPQQGVQVNALTSFGPTIGLITPYYVEYDDRANNTTRTAPYVPDSTSNINIFGPGRPLQGIGKATIAPGFHARAGINFEFGTFKSNVSGIEIGLMAECYLRRITLLTVGNSQWFFPSAYFTLFHGSRR